MSPLVKFLLALSFRGIVLHIRTLTPDFKGSIQLSSTIPSHTPNNASSSSCKQSPQSWISPKADNLLLPFQSHSLDCFGVITNEDGRTCFWIGCGFPYLKCVWMGIQQLPPFNQFKLLVSSTRIDVLHWKSCHLNRCWLSSVWIYLNYSTSFVQCLYCPRSNVSGHKLNRNTRRYELVYKFDHQLNCVDC